jgi:hypothetical protein
VATKPLFLLRRVGHKPIGEADHNTSIHTQLQDFTSSPPVHHTGSQTHHNVTMSVAPIYDRTAELRALDATLAVSAALLRRAQRTSRASSASPTRRSSYRRLLKNLPRQPFR